MAATTITRESMTDGVTAWTVARIGSAIYDQIDALVGADITFGGVISAEGFGTHTISTGGTGTNRFQIRNTTSGTANRSSFDVGNNSSAELGRFIALSSAHTPASYLLASGVVLEANGAGGLSIATTDAAGDIRLYTGGSSTLRVTVSDAGAVALGTSTNMDCGFLAYNTADDAAVASGGTVDFNTEVFDEGGNFATDTFTAPVTGRYVLSASVMINNTLGSTNNCGARIVVSNHTGGFFLGYGAVANGASELFSGSVIVDMDAADTATVQYYSDSGAATVRGDNTGLRLTWFSGRRVW